MFEQIQPAPPDAILGLTEAYRKDSNPDKINLSVGVYQDARGSTPVLASVAEASRRVVSAATSMAYLPIDGSAEYGATVRDLLFSPDHEVNTSGRAVTAHTPGGTGALRVAADFLHQNRPQATVWLTEPTWPNHPGIFAAAGVPTKTFPYFDASTNSLAFDQAVDAIRKIPAGDVILLHACCHNPTGIDPTAEQWEKLAELVAERELVPLLDFAYQGFADGLEQDATALRAFCSTGAEMIVCSSFSKNFGLYRERVSALTMVARDPQSALAVQSQVKRVIRANYSNPPAYGAQVVTTILQDPELRLRWEGEVAEMRDRINGMRKLLVETLAEKGVSGDFSFIIGQRGMFSFSGLTADEVDALREKFSIYIVRSGRINVAGISPQNVGRLCEAIAQVRS